ncbi:MAG TPA: MFS transporter [Acidimicrobiales bacterium]|nr:MFS transporter [Acidimicrobiales bacterium]
MVRVLRVPGFGPLLAGQAVNAIGNWIAIIAIWGFAAFRFDAGAADLALLFVLLSVPGAVLGPLLGVPIDRFGPRHTLIVANLLGFLNALALTQADSYLAVILLALPLGLIEQLATSSLDALPPRLVPDESLVGANALLGGAQDLAIVVGPLLAAVVNVRWGLAGAFLADALTFLVGLAVALPLDVGPAAAEPDGASPWRSVGEGLSLVRRTPGLRWTLGVAAGTYLLWSLFGVLEPLYVRDVLGESDTVFAMIQAVFGVGLVGAGLTLAAVGDRVARPRYVALAMVVSGMTAALYLGTRELAVAFVAVFLWGIDVAFFYVPAKTLLQRYAPVTAHGRVLSLNQSLEPLMSMFMAPVAGVAAGVLSVQQAGVAGGALAVVGGVVALRRARRLPPPPPPGPVDPAAGTPRDAVALGGQAPG